MSTPARTVLGAGANTLIQREKMVLGARRLPPLPSVSDLLKIYQVRARKQLSQNFLLHPGMCRRFVQAAGPLQGRTVVEVGPGPGNLTRIILGQAPRELIAIEKDRHFVPTLEMLVEAAPGVMKFALGDIMKYDLSQVLPKDQAMPWDDSCPPIKIIGNLPFNVSSPLVIKWLHEISTRSGPFALGRVQLTLAFQKEVAERIVAPPLWDERSRLSVMCQIYCSSKIMFTISGKCFSPRPKVDVSVVSMIPLRKPRIDLPFKLIEKVVRTLFQAKRKNMIGVLKNLFPPSHSYLLPELLSITRMDTTLKPFLLSVEDIGRVCYAYRHLCEVYPHILDYDFRQPALSLAKNPELALINPQLVLPNTHLTLPPSPPLS